MAAMERLNTEQHFHDSQARERAHHFRRRPASLCFSDDDYLDHETWIRPAFARLGALRRLRALDFGCGHGMAAVVMARRGAHVTAFDISGEYVGEAHRRALANQVDVNFVQANGERLPFADATFDRIWGNAVLHHLDVAVAARELERVLRPGGIAVFCEPWGENPFLNWARTRLPYPGKHRTVDEKPLCHDHLHVLSKIFPHLEWQGFQFLGMARRLVGSGRLSAGLLRCDERLFKRFPGLQQYARYIFLILQR